MPSHRHVSLITNRHRRKDRIKGLSSLSAFDNKRWKFLDNVNISYGKPSTCSNNGFLPLCEQGYVFYKGDTPDTRNTSWASDKEYNNATNEWVLFPRDIENKLFRQTYCQKFSWDLQYLLMSLCGMLEYSRFIYGTGSSLSSAEIKSIYFFCKKNSLTVELIAQDNKSAEDILNCIEGIDPKTINEVLKK